MSLIFFLTFEIGTIVGEDALRKFPKLTSLMNCVLILSHGHADPERGFSVNKHLLNIHGSTTNEETIEAFRSVKDCFKQERWDWKYKSQQKFDQGLSKCSFLVHTDACRKEKAGIRSKKDSQKSSGVKKRNWTDLRR